LRGGDRGAESGGECDGAKKTGEDVADLHGAFPHCGEGLGGLLHIQRVRRCVG
jgi:hypothetical protein